MKVPIERMPRLNLLGNFFGQAKQKPVEKAYIETSQVLAPPKTSQPKRINILGNEKSIHKAIADFFHTEFTVFKDDAQKPTKCNFKTNTDESNNRYHLSIDDTGRTITLQKSKNLSVTQREVIKNGILTIEESNGREKYIKSMEAFIIHLQGEYKLVKIFYEDGKRKYFSLNEPNSNESPIQIGYFDGKKTFLDDSLTIPFADRSHLLDKYSSLLKHLPSIDSESATFEKSIEKPYRPSTQSKLTNRLSPPLKGLYENIGRLFSHPSSGLGGGLMVALSMATLRLVSLNHTEALNGLTTYDTTMDTLRNQKAKAQVEIVSDVHNDSQSLTFNEEWFLNNCKLKASIDTQINLDRQTTSGASALCRLPIGGLSLKIETPNHKRLTIFSPDTDFYPYSPTLTFSKPQDSQACLVNVFESTGKPQFVFDIKPGSEKEVNLKPKDSLGSFSLKVICPVIRS